MSIYCVSILLMSPAMAWTMSWKDAVAEARLTMKTNWPRRDAGGKRLNASFTLRRSLFLTVAFPKRAGTLTPILTPSGSGR